MRMVVRSSISGFELALFPWFRMLLILVTTGRWNQRLRRARRIVFAGVLPGMSRLTRRGGMWRVWKSHISRVMVGSNQIWPSRRRWAAFGGSLEIRRVWGEPGAASWRGWCIWGVSVGSSRPSQAVRMALSVRVGRVWCLGCGLGDAEPKTWVRSFGCGIIDHSYLVEGCSWSRMCESLSMWIWGKPWRGGGVRFVVGVCDTRVSRGLGGGVCGMVSSLRLGVGQVWAGATWFIGGCYVVRQKGERADGRAGFRRDGVR